MKGAKRLEDKFFLIKKSYSKLFIALHKLNKDVYDLGRQWYDQLPSEQKLKIRESFGVSQIPDTESNIEYCGKN